MKTLLLMRHSTAASDNPAWTDRDRPLKPEGRELARATAEQLRSVAIDCIVSSSAARAAETSEIIASENAIENLLHLDELYLAHPGKYRDAAIAHARPEDDTVLVVGHNPGIASLIYNWATTDTHVTPGTVARFEFATDDWNRVAETSPTLVSIISNGQFVVGNKT